MYRPRNSKYWAWNFTFSFSLELVPFVGRQLDVGPDMPPSPDIPPPPGIHMSYTATAYLIGMLVVAYAGVFFTRVIY